MGQGHYPAPFVFTYEKSLPFYASGYVKRIFIFLLTAFRHSGNFLVSVNSVNSVNSVKRKKL